MPGVADTIARVGVRIRSLRLERNLTQEQAAERAHLSVKHLQDVERGETNPTIASLIALSRALGVTLSELFARIDSERKSHRRPAPKRR